TPLMATTARVGAAGLVAALACHLLGVPAAFDGGGLAADIGNVVLSVGCLLAIYGGLLALARSRELSELVTVVRERLLPGWRG
ncbi:MAG TPA: hypothetical protein VFD41_00395, partial [Actinomycetales bacterium]|nr:hypothetical protein [Actinomycetales bacterium]